MELVEPESDVSKVISDISLGMMNLESHVVGEVNTCSCSCDWNLSGPWDCQPVIKDVKNDIWSDDW